MSILMIGTQRSGSNLLRLMLDQIPSITAPHPPHILQRLMPLLPMYGDLSIQSSFNLLADDICRLIELNPVPWEGVTFNRQDVISRCRENSIVAVFCAVHDILAETRQAETWCCKSLANVNYLAEISAYLPRAKYLYLYRDGRDVAVSFKKAVVGEKHFYHIAQEWGRAQRTALAMKLQCPDQQFFSLCYETLISEPEQSLQDLCHFLEVDYNPSMLNFHQSTEATSTASASSLWSNVTKPLMSQNTKKFLTQATEEDVRIFELVAGDVLDELGYERVYTAKHAMKTFSPEEIMQFNAENQYLKSRVQDEMDAEDRERRERQAALLREIKARSPMMTVN